MTYRIIDYNIGVRAFNEVLKYAIARDISLVKACKQIGICRSHINRWGNGDGIPSSTTLKILDNAGIDIYFVVTGKKVGKYD